MTELEELDQRLDLARAGLSSTPGAKARVEARLVARGAFAAGRARRRDDVPEAARRGLPPVARRGAPQLVGAALMAVSFAAGYGLRDVQAPDEPAPVAPPVVVRGGERAAVIEAPPSEPARERVASADDAASALPPLDAAGAADDIDDDAAASAAESGARPPPRHARAAKRRRDAAPASGATATPRFDAEAAPTAGASDERASISSELALLRRAERAIRAGDPTLALILLDRLEREHPASRLTEERAAARILVECARAGALARPEARRFLERHPSSVYSDRINRACELTAPDSSTGAAPGGH